MKDFNFATMSKEVVHITKYLGGKSVATTCDSFVSMTPNKMLKSTIIDSKLSRPPVSGLFMYREMGMSAEVRPKPFRIYRKHGSQLYVRKGRKGLKIAGHAKKSKQTKHDNMSKVIDIREYWNGWKGWDTIGEPETDYPNRRFNVVAKDPDSEAEQVFQFTHSDHSMVRSAQRGIEGFRMQVAIRYGRTIRKQGLEYCILGKNDIPEHLSHMCAKLRDTVVIISGVSDCVITCYRGKDPFKRIKKKSKRLSPMKTKRA
jgi:hypothetical protein